MTQYYFGYRVLHVFMIILNVHLINQNVAITNETIVKLKRSNLPTQVGKISGETYQAPNYTARYNRPYFTAIYSIKLPE